MIFLAQLIASRRLLAKFFFSLAGLLAILLTNLFVADHIGPEAYGQYGFIVAAATFITQVVIVTLPESYIFYLSANKYRLQEINAAYAILMGVITLICLLIFAGSMLTHSIRSFLWPNIDKLSYLLLGFCYVLLQNAQQSLTKYGDCSAQYDKVESCRFVSRLLGLVLVIFCWSLGYLSLMTFFQALVLSMLVFFSLFFRKLSFPIAIQNKKHFKLALNSLYQGWKPVSFYAFLNALYTYGGRYGIQITAGGVQQGFYTYAMFLAMLPIAALTPMVTVYMSHMSKLYSQDENEKLIQHYLLASKITILLYGLFSFFLITNANSILNILSGEAYQGSCAALQWLAVFSFLNLFDLLGGNLYFCTERNKQYRRIYNATCFIGIIAIAGFSAFYRLSALNLSIIVTLAIALQVALHLYGNVRFFSLKASALFQAFVMPLFSLLMGGFLINVWVENWVARVFFYGLFALFSLGFFYLKQGAYSSLRYNEN